jgi:hypothetical protein
VLICTGVGEPSRSRNIPNNKVSRGLLSATAKLGTMGSYVTETGAQLAAYMLLSRPQPNIGGAPGLLPVVWLPICNKLAPFLGSVTVAIGTPITSRATPVAAEVGAVMRHNMVSRKLWCWQQWWLLWYVVYESIM